MEHNLCCCSCLYISRIADSGYYEITAIGADGGSSGSEAGTFLLGSYAIFVQRFLNDRRGS